MIKYIFFNYFRFFQIIKDYEYFFLKLAILFYNFQQKLQMRHPLDKHSKPNDPTPENKSNIFDNFIFTLNLFECKIILNKDSLVKSLSGLVDYL